MSMMAKERELVVGYEDTMLLNEPLADYTTWRVGGPAAKLYKPAAELWWCHGFSETC